MVTPVSCPRGLFACSNGHCINQTLVCNGHNDCHDEQISDENAVSAVSLCFLLEKIPNSNELIHFRQLVQDSQ